MEILELIDSKANECYGCLFDLIKFDGFLKNESVHLRKYCQIRYLLINLYTYYEFLY